MSKTANAASRSGLFFTKGGVADTQGGICVPIMSSVSLHACASPHLKVYVAAGWDGGRGEGGVTRRQCPQSAQHP